MARKYSGPLLMGKRSAKVTKDKPIRKYKRMNRKKLAKKTEEARVDWICVQINEKTEIGQQLVQSYRDMFGKDIVKVSQKGGLSDHYDMIIHHSDGTSKKCEEKGTETYRDISGSPCPWLHSVQFSNQSSKGFSISRKYLRLWYDSIICDDEFRKKYNLTDAPSYEEWLKGGPDCMMSTPSGDFQRLLKLKYKTMNNGEGMGGYGKGNNDKDYRSIVTKQFTMNDEEKQVLINEVQPIYNDMMNEKECWLQTSGDPIVDGRFAFKWHDNIKPVIITSVDVLYKKDIKFVFHLENGKTINGIMRWGGGCGFSCFRIDLR